MSDGTTLLFGLPGVRVERVERSTDGMRVVDVATAEEAAAACPSCGVLSTSRKGRVTTSPRDIPYGTDRIMGAVEQDPLAVPRGLLRARLVHRVDRAGPLGE